MTSHQLLALCAMLAGSTLSLHASAADQGKLWGTVSLASHHFTNGLSDARRQQVDSYNEKNYGLGLEYHHNRDWRTIGGIYNNSFRRNSLYAAVAWTPAQFGPVSAGILAGTISGYVASDSSRFMPLAAGIVAIEGETVGANLLIIPPIRKSSSTSDIPWVAAVQVKFRF